MTVEKIYANKFLQFAELSKTLKSDIIYLTDGNKLHGLDNNSNYLKYTSFNEEDIFTMYDLVLVNKELVEFVKNLQLQNILEDVLYIDFNNMLIFNPLNPGQYLSICNNNLFFKNLIVSTFRTITMYKGINYGSIKEDVNFLNSINIKSKDGLQLYRKDDYIMSIFTGLLPVNKSDDVLLTISNIDSYSFIANFKIIKKKKATIDVYIRYMKLK